MAKPKKDDRRAVIEQMRKEQQRAERRRTGLVVAAAVAVGAVIIGFAVVQYLAENKKDSRALDAIGVAAASAGCQEPQAKPAEGNNDHRIEGERILYPAAPPAFGPHWGNFLQGSEIRKFYTADDRPPVERLVHSLEHGYNILWYDETIAESATALEDVQSITKKFPSTSDLNDKFIAAPWTTEDGNEFPEGTHVALTHWSMGGTNGNPDEQVGVWQYCAAVSGEAVQQFIDDYPYSDSPEPTAP